MPKRKRVSRDKPGWTGSKRSRKAAVKQCPYLPQELWDRIIDISLNVDDLIGLLPREAHHYFRSPFMQVNRACRQHVCSVLSSLTWIHLQANDHRHAKLVQDLADHFPVVDSFWVPSLQTWRAPRLIFEFGRKVARMITRQHEEDTKVYVVPYSCAYLLRLLTELELSWLNLTFVRSEGLEGTRLYQVELLLSASTIDDITPRAAGVDDIDIELWLDGPTTRSELTTLMCHRALAAMQLRLSFAYPSVIPCGLALLYWGRTLVFHADAILKELSEWVLKLDDPDWRNDAYVTQHLHIMFILSKMESAAFEVFAILFEIDKEWTISQAQFLTKGFRRWTFEPLFSFFGLPDDRLAKFFHTGAEALEIYDEINSRLPNPTGFFYSRARRRVYSLLAAAHLGLNKELMREATFAKEALFQKFPSLKQTFGEQGMVDQYTDIDGNDCEWRFSDLLYWSTRALPYMHRAQQLVQSFSDAESSASSP